jgi:hypothetical protein
MESCKHSHIKEGSLFVGSISQTWDRGIGGNLFFEWVYGLENQK